MDYNNDIHELSDYELYQSLDESGYIPSEKNLAILKEDCGILDEGLIKAIKKHINRKRAKKRMKQMWKDGKAGPQVKKQAEEAAAVVEEKPEGEEVKEDEKQ